MRKLFAALGLVAFVGLLGLFFFEERPATLPPTLNFVEFLPPDGWENRGTRRAAFAVTNSSPRSIAVVNLQVDVFTNGIWQAHSNYVAGVVAKANPSQNTVVFLDSGSSETVVVDCPAGRRCRLGVIYSSQSSGIQALFARIRFAYLHRDWEILRNPSFRSFTRRISLQSEAVPEGHE